MSIAPAILLLYSILGQAFEILLNRFAEMGGKLAANLLQNLLPFLGREIAPAILFADVLGIDFPLPFRPAGGRAVLGGIGGTVPLGLRLLLLLLELVLVLERLLAVGVAYVMVLEGIPRVQKVPS